MCVPDNLETLYGAIDEGVIAVRIRKHARKELEAYLDCGLQVQVMRERHKGKMRHWFTATARWHIVSLDAISDLSTLVFLECAWTKAERLVIADGPNYRLLDRVAANARAAASLARPSAQRHKTYYDELATGSLHLEGENRVTICSAEENEISSNPAARYYLLDGVGRCLPYHDPHG